jgi:hypothetical protein
MDEENERVTLVNLENGHVTIIAPKKKGSKYIYGTIEFEPGQLTRDDKWDLTKYKVLPGARWDLVNLEREYYSIRTVHEDEERKARWQADGQGRDLSNILMDEWKKNHPKPKNRVLEEVRTNA